MMLWRLLCVLLLIAGLCIAGCTKIERYQDLPFSPLTSIENNSLYPNGIHVDVSPNAQETYHVFIDGNAIPMSTTYNVIGDHQLEIVAVNLASGLTTRSRLNFVVPNPLAAGMSCSLLAKSSPLTYSGYIDNYYAWTPVLNNVKQIVSAQNYSMAVMNDGTLWVTGDNSFGQLGLGDIVDRAFWTMSSITGVSKVAIGTNHSLLLKEDGSVWVTGCNQYGQLGMKGQRLNQDQLLWSKVLDGITEISLGPQHSLALKDDGTLLIAGSIIKAPYDSTANTLHNDWIPSLANVKTIASGFFHAFAVKRDGTLWACGDNTYGQLGNGINGNQYSSWVEVPVSLNIVSIAGGGSHSMLLTGAGDLYVTGANGHGQLGLGHTRNQAHWLLSLSQVKKMAIWDYQSCAIKNDGSFWQSGHHELGVRDETELINWKQLSSGVKAAAAGQGQSFAIKEDGTLLAMGFNNLAQLGIDFSANKKAWSTMSALSGVVASAVGYHHTFLLKQDGSLWTNFCHDDQIEWQQILSDVKAVEAGPFHVMALKKNGRLLVCGANWSGQLGIGFEDGSQFAATWQSVLPNIKIKSISAGFEHSLALSEDGVLYGTGANLVGQLGLKTASYQATWIRILDEVSTMAAGGWHSLAVRQDHSLWVTGMNSSGQLGLGYTSLPELEWKPVPSNIVSSISYMRAGNYHSLAIKQDGTLWLTGDNSSGQLGLKTGTTSVWTKVNNLMDVIAIAAGNKHNLALRRNGDIYGAGDNFYLQLGGAERTVTEWTKLYSSP